MMFGKNAASYKFALGRALLDLAPLPGQLVTLEELAGPFSDRMREHLRMANKQGTSASSRFLAACRQANEGTLERERLLDATVQFGFNNVIDAFHVVGSDDVPCRFFDDERRKSSSGIRITNAFDELKQSDQAANLPHETEARWRLVETAWELGVSRALVAVNHDPQTETFFALDSSRRRKSITGAREALSGYQKGHCFYCFASFSLVGLEPPDVDHFFPHTLKHAGFGGSVDGVWNLVLSCRGCNRGKGGKSSLVPTLKLLQRLSTRNEFLIASHHPLRETLIAQVGADGETRRQFLNDFHREALARLIHEWQTDEVREPLF
jgi:hypothetical protein